ncbi:PREDICTED: uncharacterized protein LOC106926209 [Poecilia mexicana]|uniref:uncharacterized protein LOC106926209 n=1 Tax=Poecilia mexicana TaxID=48701 RepID=UPI00072DBA82|nr:PREDICTED: uncharacterized protein LOC106926209 [Poecilia mexicana]
MESNQRTIEEVASDNIVEREVQPPKPPKRKKKMPFAVWWALHASEELKMSTENMEQQDSSLVIENGSSAKALQKVDQKGDGQPPESESNENNQVPFETCSEEDILTDQEISAGNIEKQNNSLVSAEESIVGVQETVDTTEKEQPSKSEEQPPKTRRNKMKVKMIPWSMWLEKYPPAELRTSGEITGTGDDSLVTKQESISVVNETPEKEESSKTNENVINQDTSLPEEEGDQEDSFKTEICKEEVVILTSEPVTEKKSVTETQKKVDQKREKQSKTRRNKKTPLLWESFPQSDACIDLTFFTENSDINDDPLLEKQNYQGAFSSSGKKTLWKMLPNSEPCIDISFFAENMETKNLSMPAEKRDEVASLEKDSYSKNTATQLVTKEESILKPQETLDQKGEKHPSLGKPMDNIQTGNLTEVPVNQTEENVQEESLIESQNLPHSPEKTTKRSDEEITLRDKTEEEDYGFCSDSE